jgi:sugar phosphate isomerase/epimerase
VGYTGIGVAWQEYAAWTAGGLTDHQLAAAVADEGVQVAELEFLHGWASDDLGSRREAAAREEVVWAMAATFGARHVNVGEIGASPPPRSFDQFVERFAALCERAARHGLLVAYECIPGTVVPDLPAAVRLVLAADRDNGGVAVDAVHLFRGSRRPQEVVRSVPEDRVVSVQIADGDAAQLGALAGVPPGGAPPPGMARFLPGQGVFDLTTFLLALDSMGVDAPIGVELINPAWQDRPVDEVARLSYEAAAAVVGRARRRRAAPGTQQRGDGYQSWSV